MKKWITVTIITISLALIFSATFYINRLYIKKNTDMENVAVTTKKITPYSKLLKTDLKLKKKVKSEIPEDAIYNINELFKDKEVLYAGELGFGEGDILRKSRITDNENNPFSKALELNGTGKMLVSVNTDLVRSTANFVKKGVRVDAVVFVKAEQRGMPDMVITKRENPNLANLLVIDKKNDESTEPKEEGREAIPYVVTIETDKLEVASDLVRFNEIGKIYLLPVGVDTGYYLKQQTLAVNN